MAEMNRAVLPTRLGFRAGLLRFPMMNCLGVPILQLPDDPWFVWPILDSSTGNRMGSLDFFRKIRRLAEKLGHALRL